MILLTGLILAIPGLIYWLWKQESIYAKQAHQKWLRYPDVELYLRKTTPGGRKSGPTCHHCGSRSIRQLGWEERHDARRLHKCNQCNTSLYRSYR
ncbi:hypothetical protein [Pseudomonas zhanjiangensis]|uniref:Uncharacterized protein n=1 Tax=Pseudomonas zhanjiangensis TaxID=3239015 RepID=A0ABV3YYK7_9PSED